MCRANFLTYLSTTLIATVSMVHFLTDQRLTVLTWAAGTYSQCVPLTCLYLLLNAGIALIQHFVNKRLRGMFVEKIGRPYLTLLTHILTLVNL